MRITIPILVALLTMCACTDHDTTPSSVGAVVTRDCGDAPLAPGWSASFDQQTGAATVSGSDYAAITAWRGDVETWESCVVDHP